MAKDPKLDELERLLGDARAYHWLRHIGVKQSELLDLIAEVRRIRTQLYDATLFERCFEREAWPEGDDDGY